MNKLQIIEKIMKIIFPNKEDLLRAKKYLVLYAFGECKASERPILVLSSENRANGKTIFAEHMISNLKGNQINFNGSKRQISNSFNTSSLLWETNFNSRKFNFKIAEFLQLSNQEKIVVNLKFKKSFTVNNNCFPIIILDKLPDYILEMNDNILHFNLGESKIEDFKEIENIIINNSSYNNIIDFIKNNIESYVRSIIQEVQSIPIIIVCINDLFKGEHPNKQLLIEGKEYTTLASSKSDYCILDDNGDIQIYSKDCFKLR